MAKVGQAGLVDVMPSLLSALNEHLEYQQLRGWNGGENAIMARWTSSGIRRGGIKTCGHGRLEALHRVLAGGW